MTARDQSSRPDLLDTVLIVVFLIGIYLEYSPKLAAGVPVPAAPAGLAGVAMLLRNYRYVEERQLVALISVIALFLLSIVFVADSNYLGERAKGFLQLSYSLVIGYGAFLTMLQYDRDRLSRIFLGFVLVILIGCALETYTGFVAISDFVRTHLFDAHLYAATLRDEALYGGRRPMLFTSEPSYVGFAFTIYAFFWYVLSTSSSKTVVYLLLLGAGLFVVRSPTILLGFVLIAPYQLLIAGRSAHGNLRGADMAFASLVILAILALGGLAVIGSYLFEERINQISSRNDASYFYRIVGPISVAWDTILHRPIAGAGLTGEELIAGRAYQIYVTAPGFSPRWRVDRISEVLTNYFWLHWIYLGVGWGIIMMLAVGKFLQTLKVPSIAFCALVWAIMGQASGAYVSPKPWTVLLFAAAVSLLHHWQPMRLRKRPGSAKPLWRTRWTARPSRAPSRSR
jgi:hypothetical protein